MTILIEKDDTLEYLNNAGGWTKNPLDGRRFATMIVAYGVAKSEAIGRFNIVCHIPATNQFVNLNHGRGKGLSEE
jgi:hypothetical protein